jgi:hypothetical protein
MHRLVPFAVVALTVCAACDTNRVAQLEKENQALQAQLRRANLDLQDKCSTAAKKFIDADWRNPGPNTVLFEFNNHYNQALNKCFVSITWHYLMNADGLSWQGLMMVYDVFERTQYGDFGEAHFIHTGSTPQDTVNTCVVQGTKCTSVETYISLIRSLMSQ